MAIKIIPTTQTYRITDGRYYIDVIVTNQPGRKQKVELFTERNDKEFIFAQPLTGETLERWQAVTKLLAKAVTFLKGTYGKL